MTIAELINLRQQAATTFYNIGKKLSMIQHGSIINLLLTQRDEASKLVTECNEKIHQLIGGQGENYPIRMVEMLQTAWSIAQKTILDKINSYGLGSNCYLTDPRAIEEKFLFLFSLENDKNDIVTSGQQYTFDQLYDLYDNDSIFEIWFSKDEVSWSIRLPAELIDLPEDPIQWIRDYLVWVHPQITKLVEETITRYNESAPVTYLDFDQLRAMARSRGYDLVKIGGDW